MVDFALIVLSGLQGIKHKGCLVNVSSFTALEKNAFMIELVGPRLSTGS